MLMKTLYISDLDGTLLNDNAELTDETISMLNKLAENSVLFTVATARTYSTVVPLMKKVKLNCPVILMNGVCIYDTAELKPIKIHKMDFTAAKDIIGIFENFGKYPMLYYDNNGNLSVEYIKITTLAQEKYVYSRKENYNKKMIQVEDYSLYEDSTLIYIAILDKREELQPIYDIISKRNDVSSNFYADNYSGDYFLEIYSCNASKAKTSLELKKMLDADKIVSFGDNLNDIPMFEVSDECYAVRNAYEEVKRYATDKDFYIQMLHTLLKILPIRFQHLQELQI